MTRAMRLIAILFSIMRASLVAEARAPRTSAAEHVAAANRAFVAKDYEAALAELRIAYQLAPRPEFLLTFAQIYRGAGRLQQALEACNSYLATVPNGPLTPGAQKLAAMLRAEIAAAQPPPPPAPQQAPQPSPPPVAAVTPPPQVIATPSPPATDNATDSARARRRRLALGLSLGIGAAVVVGVAVGLGVGLGANQPRASTYGPIGFTPMP
jgi:hypothetical protein